MIQQQYLENPRKQGSLTPVGYKCRESIFSLDRSRSILVEPCVTLSLMIAELERF
jgi:hypothetical protein